MTILFHIEYRTDWGEEVKISGSIPELGSWDKDQASTMHTVDGINWSFELHMQMSQYQMLEYDYCIFRDGKMIHQEWNSFHRSLLLSSDNERKYQVFDSWKNIPEQLYFYSSAFTDSLLAHRQKANSPQEYPKGLMIKVHAPRINSNYAVAICGNQPQLGNWDPAKAILMSDVNFPEWQVELDADKITFPLEYKFLLYNKQENNPEDWENNPNRYMADPGIKDNELIILADRYVNFDIPAWKGAGVAIPIFSLRSENSFGIGDFGDLKLMVDWAVATNQKVIQTLPINDTTITHTWTDSYPYSSISIYALNPLYLDLRQLGTLKDKKIEEEYQQKQKELNSLPQMDFEAVSKAKWKYFKLIFEQDGGKTLATDEFREFFIANKEWLMPYAAFSHLRDKYQNSDFREWPEYSVYNAEEIEKLCRPGTDEYPEIALYYYLQFHLHTQLLSVTIYARAQEVVLKGDIPIGISRNSVEAWTEPHYFNLTGQAGAPPDAFSVNGQNWGLPTYNWDVMEQDGYKWWMKRFFKMSEYFDAYRIDHILGFFRIWEIPLDSVHGLLGQFVPALPMSKEEIESYGLPFREDFYLKPYIHESFLGQIFGPHLDYVKKTFLETTDTFEVYRMRSKFDTQRKVETYFKDKNDDKSIWIRDGLYSLISNVLFVRDLKEPDKYHPRISAQLDFLYRSLTDGDKNAFNRLYDQYYYHRHNQFWYDQAMKKLPQLTQSTHMLVCGEDLGMIPESVHWAMDELRILSLEIQRMPKDSYEEFAVPDRYPYVSVSTISTHDMSTLRGWWEEDHQKIQRYYNNILGHYGAAPDTASPEICQEVVRNHLYGNSILCIPALQDWMSIDGQWRNPNVEEERINIPSNPKHYWRYRMHLTLEELMQAESLNNMIREFIQVTGRNVKK